MAGKIFVKLPKSNLIDILWALLDFLRAERQTKEALLEPTLH